MRQAACFYSGAMKIFAFRALLAPLLLSSALLSSAQGPKPDTLVFTNGNALDGKLVRGDGGGVVFHSDMAGDLTVPFGKIKELHSDSDFVVIKKGSVKYAATATGTIAVADGKLIVTVNGVETAMPTGELAFLIDRSTYDKELRHGGFFHGWNGTVTGGATLVRSTQTATTLTAAVALVRAIPTVPYLPARNRTTLNLAESYGKQTSPVIPPTVPASSDVVVQTSIFHADAERDEYFSSRFYALGNVSFDHNYSQGLSLQQVYGGGIGWTPIKTGRQQLDVKGDVHYEKQEFLPATPTAQPAPAVNIVGTTVSETYLRHLPRKVEFTESGTYLPAWNETSAYSANITAALSMPVFKRLSATVSTTDNYLNDPAPYYKRNSFQFVTGITYTLH